MLIEHMKNLEHVRHYLENTQNVYLTFEIKRDEVIVIMNVILNRNIFYCDFPLQI